MTDPEGIVSKTEIGRGPFHATLVHRSDGAQLLIPRERIGSYPVSVTDWLLHWSQRAPARVLLGQRDAVGHWSTVTYAEALRRARSIGGALVRAGLSSERPIAILSGNSIEHQLLAFAAMYVGVPYAPVSPSYSLAEGSLEKLRHILKLLTPGLVAAFGAEDFSRALSLPELEGTRVVRGVAELESLGNPLDADGARSDVTADSIAKFLLTSGSTGTPKAVITTQRMLASNQAMIQQALPFLAEEPPVLVDWLPWNHVFGGSHNVGIALTHGGSLYIDEGRPTPGGIAQTVRNLRQIAPTVYFNVPKGFEMLIPHLHSDAALRSSFFSRLRANFVAGAGLSQVTWDALDDHRPGSHRDRAGRNVRDTGSEVSRRDRPAHRRQSPQARPRGRQTGAARKGPERDARLLAATRVERGQLR
jgi:feruloyl-CoA synthase